MSNEECESDFNFQAGETVVLKSGGPLMTVRGISGYNVICNWFDDFMRLHEGTFNPFCLTYENYKN